LQYTKYCRKNLPNPAEKSLANPAFLAYENKFLGIDDYVSDCQTGKQHPAPMRKFALGRVVFPALLFYTHSTSKALAFESAALQPATGAPHRGNRVYAIRGYAAAPFRA